MDALREEAAAAAEEARQEDLLVVVSDNSSVSDIMSDVSKDDIGFDDLGLPNQNPNVNQAEEGEVVREEEDDATDEEEDDETGEEEDDDTDEEETEKNLSRRRSRTSVIGNTTRKEPNFGFKKKMVRKFRELEPRMVDEVSTRRCMKELRQYGHTLNPTFIIHHRRQLQKWATTDELSTHGNGQRCRQKRREHFQLEHLDDILRAYKTAKREGNDFLTRQNLLDKANELLRDEAIRSRCGDKKSVTMSYICKFMKRSKLRVKNVKKKTELTAADIKERAQKFHSHIDRMLPFVDGVANMDEIPDSLSGTLGTLRTVADVSDVDVRVNIDPQDLKRTCTVLPIAALKKTAAGDWEQINIPPIILFKGAPAPGGKVAAETYFPGAKVLWTTHGVMNATTMKKVAKHIKDHMTLHGVKRPLLILDSAKCHTTAAVVNFLWSMEIAVAVIPPHMTSWLQYVDTYLAARFRQQRRVTYLPFFGKKKTAATKRRLLVFQVATVLERVTQNVREHFGMLGYTNPRLCRLHQLDEYLWTPPPAESLDQVADEEKFKARIEEARKEVRKEQDAAEKSLSSFHVPSGRQTKLEAAQASAQRIGCATLDSFLQKPAATEKKRRVEEETNELLQSTSTPKPKENAEKVATPKTQATQVLKKRHLWSAGDLQRLFNNSEALTITVSAENTFLSVASSALSGNSEFLWMVVNTEPASSRGLHWILVRVFAAQRILFVIDSLKNFEPTKKIVRTAAPFFQTVLVEHGEQNDGISCGAWAALLFWEIKDKNLEELTEEVICECAKRVKDKVRNLAPSSDLRNF